MSKRRRSTEQIIHKLREAEVELSRGRTIAEDCKQLGITDQTFNRWRREYGALGRQNASCYVGGV